MLGNSFPSSVHTNPQSRFLRVNVIQLQSPQIEETMHILVDVGEQLPERLAHNPAVAFTVNAPISTQSGRNGRSGMTHAWMGWPNAVSRSITTWVKFAGRTADDTPLAGTLVGRAKVVDAKAQSTAANIVVKRMM